VTSEWLAGSSSFASRRVRWGAFRLDPGVIFLQGAGPITSHCEMLGRFCGDISVVPGHVQVGKQVVEHR